jgi:PEP-CTERM motif
LNSISLNTGNSTMLLVGNALSASATQLTFDFTAGGSSNSYLIFHDPSVLSWWDTVSQPPYLGYQGIAELTGLGGENYSYIAGTQVIAGNGTPVSTPEPGTSSLMLIGAGLLGLMVMRKGISVGHQQAA